MKLICEMATLKKNMLLPIGTIVYKNVAKLIYIIFMFLMHRLISS